MRKGDDAARAALIRRTIIDIARRRQRPGSGSMIGRREKHVIEWPDVSALLTGIPHAIAGAVATREYMPERATTDLDIVVLPSDAAQAAERLRAAGYTEVGPLTIGGSSWRAPSGTPVDLIEGHEPWWQEALPDAGRALNADGLPVLPLPWLVLMKLNSSRAQDVADVSRMLGLAGADALDRVRRTIATHAPDVGDDLESLIAMGKLETGGEP